VPALELELVRVLVLALVPALELELVLELVPHKLPELTPDQ